MASILDMLEHNFECVPQSCPCLRPSLRLSDMDMTQSLTMATMVGCERHLSVLPFG